MSLKMDMRHLKNGLSSLDDLNYEVLRCEYQEIVTLLQIEHPDYLMRTRSEIIFGDLLRKYTNLKIHNTFWIGSYCYDYFIPALGLAIEIDGKVHDREFKGVRDQEKIKQAGLIGIKIYSVENADFSEATVKSLLAQISKIKRLDSRGRKRLNRNIFLLTILCRYEPKELENKFSQKVIEKISEIRKLVCL